MKSKYCELNVLGDSKPWSGMAIRWLLMEPSWWGAAHLWISRRKFMGRLTFVRLACELQSELTNSLSLIAVSTHGITLMLFFWIQICIFYAVPLMLWLCNCFICLDSFIAVFTVLAVLAEDQGLWQPKSPPCPFLPALEGTGRWL